MKTIQISYNDKSTNLTIGEGADTPITIADDIIIHAIKGSTKDCYFTANGCLTWHLRTAAGRISKRLNQRCLLVRVEGYVYKSYVAGGCMRWAWIADR